MARLSFALPIFDRCERPKTASVRACRLHPGRLAQGPEEKCGTIGRAAGIVMAMAILPDSRPSVGRGVPRPEIRKRKGAVKWKAEDAGAGHKQNRRRASGLGPSSELEAGADAHRADGR